MPKKSARRVDAEVCDTASSTSTVEPTPLHVLAGASPPPLDVFDPHHLAEWSRLSLLGMSLLLCLSGSLKTLTTQFATNQRASHTSGLVLIWINYIGQWLFGVVSKAISDRKLRKLKQQALKLNGEIELNGTKSADSASPSPGGFYSTHSLLIFIAALDVFGCIVCLVASVLIGSGLYQILYGALLVMIALLSHVILGYRQNKRQWACLIFVTVGLWMTALVSKTRSSTAAAASASAKVLPICTDLFPSLLCSYVSLHTLGIFLTILGTFVYALQSVLCELMNSNPKHARVTAGELNGTIGWYGLLFSTAYVVLYTLPHYDVLIGAPMRLNHISFSDFAAILLLYLLANVFHRMTYWSVVERTGAIFAGLANALRTVAVFFLSSMLFCRESSQQCVTTSKTVASMTVVLGVVAYQLCSSGSSSASKGKTIPTRVHGAHARKSSLDMRSAADLAAIAMQQQASRKTK
jgi:uncharacterized membrane protein